MIDSLGNNNSLKSDYNNKTMTIKYYKAEMQMVNQNIALRCVVQDNF